MGFAAGIGTLAIFYPILIKPIIKLIDGWLRDIRAATKPQVVVHTTKKTPLQVVLEAIRARIALYLFLILLGVAAVLFVDVFIAPGIFDLLLSFLGL